MDNIIYNIGLLTIVVSTIFVFVNLGIKISKGFSPTSLTIKDNNGVSYWIPHRIYSAITINNLLGSDGQFNEYYE